MNPRIELTHQKSRQGLIEAMERGEIVLFEGGLKDLHQLVAKSKLPVVIHSPIDINDASTEVLKKLAITHPGHFILVKVDYECLNQNKDIQMALKHMDDTLTLVVHPGPQ